MFDSCRETTRRDTRAVRVDGCFTPRRALVEARADGGERRSGGLFRRAAHETSSEPDPLNDYIDFSEVRNIPTPSIPRGDA